jgi:ankyrin repeat/IBR domain-containing protein 1
LKWLETWQSSFILEHNQLLSFVYYSKKLAMSKMFSSFAKSIGKILPGHPKSLTESLRDAIINENEEEAIMLYTVDGHGRAIKNHPDPGTLVDVTSKTKLSLLHLAARQGLYNLVLHFLSRGGNPNCQTDNAQSSLHLMCEGVNNLDGRLEMLELFIKWNGSEVDGAYETLSLNHVDREGDTALHVAARNGLTDICKRLIESGIIISVVNKAQQTCCEIADRNSHKDLANMLELALLFQPNDITMDNFVDTHRFGNEGQNSLFCLECSSLSPTSGMKRFMQYTIDSLCSRMLVTTDIILSPGRAEALLNCFGWNVDYVLESVVKDGVNNVFTIAKLCTTPVDSPVHGSTLKELLALDSSYPSQTCSICGDIMAAPCEPGLFLADSAVPKKDQRAVYCNGGHVFCLGCWSTHLRTQVRENGAFALQCPGYKCGEILSPDWATILMPNDLVERWGVQRTRHVIDCCQTLKLCPCNECSLVIKLPNAQGEVAAANGGILPKSFMCGNDHSFCVSCEDEGHSPCSCSEWKAFKARVLSEMEAVGLGDPNKAVDDVANAIWVATYTKKCPQCQSPIEKDEGCNHMRLV